MQNILIVKTNASGDVLRTTVLLHVLKGNIFWITAAYNIPLFPNQYPNLTLIPLENISAEIFNLQFDLIINLEEDIDLAKRVSVIQTKKLVGVCWNNGTLDYSSDAVELFDMSLISKLPALQATDLKKNNKRSYQEILYGMLGENFSGQKYIIFKSGPLTNRSNIGIEKRVGRTWPNKSWNGYDELISILKTEKQAVTVFEKRNQLRQYLDDISQCKLIISGDTLAMHAALAYEIPCIAIFNCTSPNEIYDYGILRKLVSPLLLRAFYKRDHQTEVINSIPIIDVCKEVEMQIQTIQ
ncbi:MAG: glycosyltransferase family 9 protein [Chitinophagaceae bacterium]|nr:glycosyltransferase family 9 protein [Chitinophagaceae bacterium]